MKSGNLLAGKASRVGAIPTILRSTTAVALLLTSLGIAQAAPGELSQRAAQTAEDFLSAFVGAPAEFFLRADRSYYVTMRDGTRVALSLWLPKEATPDGKYPTILYQTRYGRSTAMLAGDDQSVPRWRDRGYAIVAIDVRGTTASSGARESELNPDEVGDMREIIAHVTAQSWSNGKIVATGHSYSGDTAEIALSLDAPALQGGVVREADFDIAAHLIQPGGVFGQWTLETWGALTAALDSGKVVTKDRTVNCATVATDCKLLPFLTPVDGDQDLSELRANIADRNRWTAASPWADGEFRDGAPGAPVTLFRSSPASYLQGTLAQKKPAQYWGSWMDAGTAEGVLARFRSTEAAKVPLEVWITATNHDLNAATDPFFPDDPAPLPSVAEQERVMADFVDRVMTGQPVGRVIHYTVLGTKKLKATPIWPPEGTTTNRFHFTRDRALTLGRATSGTVRGDNALEASSGEATRWTTNTTIPAQYADRRLRKPDLLSFKTTAFDRDLELVGHPVIRLKVSSESADPAFFVYLEDVAPDGRITYITEGVFRAIHRKPADPATLPYDQGPAPHSFLRKDASPMTPGKTEIVEFSLLPVAAYLKKGHALQVSIAGADKYMFATYWGGKSGHFDISTGPQGSFIDLPTRPWQE